MNYPAQISPHLNHYSSNSPQQEQVMKAKKAGYKIIQVKINGDPVEAAEKIAEARSLLDQNETLLIDANTGRFKGIPTPCARVSDSG